MGEGWSLHSYINTSFFFLLTCRHAVFECMYVYLCYARTFKALQPHRHGTALAATHTRMGEEKCGYSTRQDMCWRREHNPSIQGWSSELLLEERCGRAGHPQYSETDTDDIVAFGLRV